jgi:hypothetical protein
MQVFEAGTMGSNQATLEPDLQATLNGCRQLLSKHYGDRLKSLIVFGSAARNELTSTSDLDLLVLLSPPFDYFQELRAVVDLLYPLQLEAPYWISAKPADATEFQDGANHFYRNIQREGIVL